MSDGSPAPASRARIGRVAAAVLAAVTILATTGSAFGLAAMNRLQDNIKIDPGLTSLLDAPGGTAASPEAVDPETGYEAATILVVGSDTRTGQGGGYGNEANTSSGNGRSDTAILLHISADRSFAYGISIPRDSWVTRPSCEPDGSTDGTFSTGKFNEAYAAGGRKCVIRAVKHLTNVPIDHFVEVDFKGFKKIVDALGGVEICTTKALRDPVYQDSAGYWHGSGLDLKKGEQTLMGDQAIAFMRARNLDGSADIGRMDRQQAFVSSIIRSATDSGLLTDLPRLYSVIDAVTSSLTVDAGLSGDKLQDFVLSLADLKPGDVTFATVPWVPKGDNANVLWDTDKADVIWQAMRDDTRWPAKSTKPEGQKPLKTAPEDVTVEVLDGSGAAALGEKAARQLRKQGFVVSSVDTAPSTATTSTVSYGPDEREAARTLAYAAHVSAPTEDAALGSTVQLVVGSDWTKPAKVVIVGGGESSIGRTASDDTCIS